jgi:hypothetical protein
MPIVCWRYEGHQSLAGFGDLIEGEVYIELCSNQLVSEIYAGIAADRLLKQVL